MDFYASLPLSCYILPILLVGAWGLMWRARRRTRLWFIPLALLLPVLFIPGGMIVNWMEGDPACLPDYPDCDGTDIWIGFWLNAATGFPVAVGLAVLTLAIEAALAVRRFRLARRDSRTAFS